MRVLFIILVALATSSVAMASQNRPLAVSAITSQQAEIRSDVQAGTGRYKDMPQKTKAELLSRQSEVLAIVGGKTSSDDLSEEERLALFNHLEWIEAAVNQEDGDQMICKREKRLGSNRLERVCKTASQIEEEKEYARMNLNSGCAGGVCGDP